MKLTDFSPAFEVKKIGELIPEYLYELGEEYDFVIAGGMVTSIFTNSEVNDIDIYLKNEKDIPDFLESLREGATIVSVTDKSVLFSRSSVLINVITFRGFETVEDIFQSFDFTCVMGAYNPKTETFTLHEDFLRHNSQRRLMFHSGTSYPIMTLLRVKKYETKGYSISRNEFLRIILTCMDLNITSYHELECQIGGMYGLDINKVLDTTKEFSLKEVVNQFENIMVDFDKLGVLAKEYDNYDRLQETILKMRIKNAKSKSYFIAHDTYFIVVDGNLVGNVQKRFLDGFDKPLKKHHGKFKAYKNVKKEGNKLVSMYDTKFVYELGKELVPISKHYGLYCGSFNKIENFSYSGSPDAILLELLIDPKDIRKEYWMKERSHGEGFSSLTVDKLVVNKVLGPTSDFIKEKTDNLPF